MLLRVLGPLELAGASGWTTVPATKPRTLLAMLVIHRGTVCDGDALIDALWGETPPASAPKLVHVYISQLRRILPAGLAIRTEPAGYSLVLDPVDLDASEFERLVADGHAALTGDNAALAASILRRALELWRGRAYIDVRYEDFARAEIERLETLRRLALADRIEADLQLGRHARILGELRGLAASDPADERIAGLVMLAAYRAEGPAAALQLFESVRAALVDEFGEEPGSSLLELRDRIGRADPSLDLDPATEARSPLPAPPNALIGREREIAELKALLAHPQRRLVTLTGAGGSGKSRLALELGHALAPSFANGVTLVELASLRDPELVLSTVAHALDVDPGPDSFTALSQSLRDLEMLLILDNMEHLREAAPEVVRLLAGAHRLVVVATSRVVLHVSGEHVYPVGPLREEDAMALFEERARAQDPSFELDAETTAAAASICRRLDSLPLPIELAAARTQSLGVRQLETRLASRLDVLLAGPRDLPARQQTLRETLDWSVNLLGSDEREVLAALSVFPGGCSVEAASAVAGASDDALASLVDHHLVQTLDIGGDRRYRLLETVREYADELLDARRPEIEGAFVRWMLDLLVASDFNAVSPVKPAALERMDLELDNLRDAFRIVALEPDPTNELALAAGTWRYWWIRGHLAEGRAVLEGIIERRGDVLTRDGVRTLRAAASLTWSMGDREAAARLGERALEASTVVQDPFEMTALHNLLGVMATRRGDIQASEYHHREAMRLGSAHGLIELTMTPRLNLGVTYLESGRLDEARDLFRQVLEHRRQEGLSEGLGFVHVNLGETEYEAGDLAAAERHFVAAIESFRTVGFPSRLAGALQGLAAVEAQTGRAESAARRLGTASALLGPTGWSADGLALGPVATAAARAELGDGTFDRLFEEGVGSAATDG